MSKELKVLMLGGQRVGKSSALAAVMDSFISGKIKEFLTVKDKTILSRESNVKQSSISEKLEEIKSMLKTGIGKTILVDSGKTEQKLDYKLELTIPGSGDAMTIVFTDVNGEFFEGGHIHQRDIIELVTDYDVFIVAVDTPFMMESRKNGLVDSVINKKYNCIDSIHTFLTQINDNDGKDAKLVIFSPIKCERWADSRLEEVSSCVREDYSTTFTALEQYKSVQIEIIPIQTVGSILFEEHCEAFNFKWVLRKWLLFKKEYNSKCAVLPNGKIRLSNGDEMEASCGTVTEDASAVMIPESDIVRPNSWYKVISSEYKPHNCEQLAFHLLNFMLSKAIDAKIRVEESQNPILRRLAKLGGDVINVLTMGLWNKMRDIFGSISIEKMTAIIQYIRNENLIKYSDEGIQILKKCNFKTTVI